MIDTTTGNSTLHSSNVALPIKNKIAKHIHQNNTSLNPVNTQDCFVCFSMASVRRYIF